MFDTRKSEKIFQYEQNLDFLEIFSWNLNFFYIFILSPSPISLGKLKMFWEIYSLLLWIFEQCGMSCEIWNCGHFSSPEDLSNISFNRTNTIGVIFDWIEIGLFFHYQIIFGTKWVKFSAMVGGESSSNACVNRESF